MVENLEMRRITDCIRGNREISAGLYIAGGDNGENPQIHLDDELSVDDRKSR